MSYRDRISSKGLDRSEFVLARILSEFICLMREYGIFLSKAFQVALLSPKLCGEAKVEVLLGLILADFDPGNPEYHRKKEKSFEIVLKKIDEIHGGNYWPQRLRKIVVLEIEAEDQQEAV